VSGGFEIVLLHEKFHSDVKVALDIYRSIYDRSHDKSGVMGGVAGTSGGSEKRKLWWFSKEKIESLLCSLGQG
jgi:hypothetical protein